MKKNLIFCCRKTQSCHDMLILDLSEEYWESAPGLWVKTSGNWLVVVKRALLVYLAGTCWPQPTRVDSSAVTCWPRLTIVDYSPGTCWPKPTSWLFGRYVLTAAHCTCTEKLKCADGKATYNAKEEIMGNTDILLFSVL